MTVTQVTVPEDQGHGTGPGLTLTEIETSRQMASHWQEGLQEEGMAQDRKQKQSRSSHACSLPSGPLRTDRGPPEKHFIRFKGSRLKGLL